MSISKLLSITLLTSVLVGTSIDALEWSLDEINRLKQFSLTELEAPLDPSNKYISNLAAIELGKELFNDPRLSSNKKISCASCHIKEKAFTDNKNLAIGLRTGFRNTPSLLNVAQHNWFFADGSKDSLWAQALSSIENPAEQDFTRIEVLHFISKDAKYKAQYEEIFGHQLPAENELRSIPEKAGPNANLERLKAWKKLSKTQRNSTNLVFANLGKAIASYVSTLKSTPTIFDSFLEELLDKGSSTKLSNSAQRGLKLFTSQKAGCANCHSGSLFTNKEFHNIGTGIPGKDNGRSEVIESVIRDKFNCLGEFSDANPEQCLELQYVNKNKHSLSGAYKTPSLRNIKQTSPYMHDGRFATLNEVLNHYNTIDPSKAREIDLMQIQLSNDQQLDIINFLLSL